MLSLDSLPQGCKQLPLMMRQATFGMGGVRQGDEVFFAWHVATAGAQGETLRGLLLSTNIQLIVIVCWWLVDHFLLRDFGPYGNI
jgi:hypothetical protein